MIVKLMIAYAKTWLGIPYKWGGDSPKGVDCSGYVQLVLQKVGLDPKGDQTAQCLYNHFLQTGKKIVVPREGALLFFGKSLKSITHIAIALSSTEMIEAGGGGSKTRTREDAERDNAWVRIKPITNRRDLLITIMPDYSKGELLS